MPKFEGFEYDQLLDFLVPEKKDDIDGQIDVLTQRLGRSYESMEYDEFCPEGQKIVDAFRKWLTVFLKESKGYNADYPLFKGLSKIKDDWTFAGLFLHLIKYMWV